MHYVTQFFHKGDCEEIARRTIRKKSSVIEASGEDYAKTPNEVMSEMGSLDLVKTKVIGNLGENRFCWVMSKETEFETQPQAWVGSKEMKVMKDEERER